LNIFNILLTFVLGVIAVIWTVQSIRAAVGLMRLPRIERVPPAADEECPRISIIFAARDESEKLPAALQTMLALDYPEFEVIAINDRSADSTGRIMDEFASRNPHLRVLHITSLPPGWLGKPHALDQGYQLATGNWIVFTDADVHFAPDTLRRVITLAEEQRLDHLSLLIKWITFGFWERIVMSYFGLGFTFGQESWRVSESRSSRYVGIGAFQLIRREVYEAVGGHRRLAMEIIEDMKLGKLVKLGGFRSQVALASQHVEVRWQAGFRNLVRGTEKNFFAAAGFKLWMVGIQLTGLLLMSILPWIALPWLALTKTHNAAFVFAAVAVGVAFLFHAFICIGNRVSPIYGLTHPIGAFVFAWMIVRSAAITLWRGGVVWRDTFYPLAELRRGLV
jgi:cellulose synthase/poly-beta-1,6-N-acetylglucosamine synthase-like glycosyltransferase